MHWLVSAKYALTQAPYIGKGRWTFQTSKIKNKDLMERIVNQGKQLNADLKRLRDAQIPCEEKNPQTLWASFKSNVVKVVKKHCSKMRGKVVKKIKDLEKDLKELRENPELDTDNRVRTKEAYLANELKHLEHLQARDKKDELRAVITNHGEVLGSV